MSKLNICLIFHQNMISLCVSAIKTILDSQIDANRIYLTMSYKEFPNWEQDLPKSLCHLIMTSNKIILNWVDDIYGFEKNAIAKIRQYVSSDSDVVIIKDRDCVLKDYILEKMKHVSRGCEYKNIKAKPQEHKVQNHSTFWFH